LAEQQGQPLALDRSEARADCQGAPGKPPRPIQIAEHMVREGRVVSRSGVVGQKF